MKPWQIALIAIIGILVVATLIVGAIMTYSQTQAQQTPVEGPAVEGPPGMPPVMPPVITEGPGVDVEVTTPSDEPPKKPEAAPVIPPKKAPTKEPTPVKPAPPATKVQPPPPKPKPKYHAPPGRCGSKFGNKKCPSGKCCSRSGWCGVTDAHCFKSPKGACISQCKPTPPPPPPKVPAGRCGPSFRNTKCSSGKCCSRSGWCGVTDAHCLKSPYGSCASQCKPNPTLSKTCIKLDKSAQDKIKKMFDAKKYKSVFMMGSKKKRAHQSQARAIMVMPSGQRINSTQCIYTIMVDAVIKFGPTTPAYMPIIVTFKYSGGKWNPIAVKKK